MTCVFGLKRGETDDESVKFDAIYIPKGKFSLRLMTVV